MPEWEALFEVAHSGNPFAHPLWMLCWARHFAEPDDLFVVTVRSGGQLVGVAPFYRRSLTIGGRRVATRLMLFGGAHSAVNELPQILTHPTLRRQVLRAVVGQLYQHPKAWSWAEFVLTPEQQWFEPQWLPCDELTDNSRVIHKGTRAAVVLPLTVSSWDELKPTLKRNVKESIRRGANRLTRHYQWELVTAESVPAVRAALFDIVRLHHARSTLRTRVHHPDRLEHPARQAFYIDAVQSLARVGAACCHLLNVEGRTVAGLVVLRAGSTSFLSLSGMDPEWWSYSPLTTLQAHAVRTSIESGHDCFNFSVGPDVPKLRWSEDLRLHQDFVVVASRRLARLAFAAFWQARAAERALA